jgi:hypothetical protein
MHKSSMQVSGVRSARESGRFPLAVGMPMILDARVRPKPGRFDCGALRDHSHHMAASWRVIKLRIRLVVVVMNAMGRDPDGIYIPRWIEDGVDDYWD